MSNDSQDLGQQLANAGSKVANNKLARKGMKKAIKAIAKLAMKVIKKLILVLVKGIVGFIGPWGIVILLAVILMLVLLDAVISKFDWFSGGNERTEIHELFDETIHETLISKHDSITLSLGSEVSFPSDVISEHDPGLRSSDVTVNSNWIKQAQVELTPSWAITAAAFHNHVYRNNDKWYKDYKKLDHEDPSTKQEMIDDINKEFSYYFGDPSMEMNISHSTETGETVTTQTITTCDVTEEKVTETKTTETTYQIKTKVEYTECRWETRMEISPDPWGGVTITPISELICEPNPNRTEYHTEDVETEPNLPESNYKIVSNTRQDTTYGYDMVQKSQMKIISEETSTETTTETVVVGTETEESEPTTESLPERQIATNASTLYASMSIPYKYKETPFRTVSTEETTTTKKNRQNCVVETKKKFKVKVVDTNSSPVVTKTPEVIIPFLTSSMPEGAKTELIQDKDVDFYVEMMMGLDKTLPPIDKDQTGGGTGGGTPIGDPSIIVPVTEGTFSIPTTGRVTSEFGPRWGTSHTGIDIGGGGRSNVPIVASAAGEVYEAGSFSGVLGWYVSIKHNIDGDFFATRYYHMAGPPVVSIGDKVEKGQLLGIMGTTGDSTGVHLHFEIRVGSTSRDSAVNPRIYVDFQ